MIKRGFTFIELLVVVSIILLTTGMGIANFVRYQDKKEVEEAAKQVRELAIAARTKVAARETPKEVGICDPETSPIIAFHLVSPSPNQVEIRPVCGLDMTDLSNEGLPVSEMDKYDLPPGVSLDGGVSVYFYSLGKGANLDGTVMPITIKNDNDVSFGFEIDEAGNITQVVEIDN